MGPTAGAIAQAAHALFERGYFQQGVGEQDLRSRENAYRAAERFFDEPTEVRLASRLPLGCGYLPFGAEHSGEPEHPDEIEGFVASARTSLSARSLPAAAAALHAALLDVFDRTLALAEAILIEVAARCGCDQREALRQGLRRWSLIQVHRARPIMAGAMINTPHEDGHFLTFTHATAPGLEIENDGLFEAVERAEGRVMIMAGSALTLMTGGLIKPVRHLVRSYAIPRLSMMVFADLDPALCTAWRSTASNFGIDIGAHVLGNSRRYGVEGFPPD